MNVVQDSTLSLIYDLAESHNKLSVENESLKKENAELKTKLDENYKKS